MIVHYKAARLALYGNGDNFHISTVGGLNRIAVFDSRAIIVLNWVDHFNQDSKFSINVNRTNLASMISRGKPTNGFYAIRISENNGQCFLFDHAILTSTNDNKKALIGSTGYTEVDPNIFNPYFAGLSIDQSIMTGSVSLDFDRLRYVFMFLDEYIAAGKFGAEEFRIVNFQTVNEEFPLVIQAFMKIDNRITCDLDVVVFSFRK